MGATKKYSNCRSALSSGAADGGAARRNRPKSATSTTASLRMNPRTDIVAKPLDVAALLNRFGSLILEDNVPSARCFVVLSQIIETRARHLHLNSLPTRSAVTCVRWL